MKKAKLSLETAKEFYNQGGAAKQFALDNYSEEELTKKELPKTYEECRRLLPREGAYVCGVGFAIGSSIKDNGFLPSIEIAEQVAALQKLLVCREAYRDGWKPVFCGDNYYISRFKNDLGIVFSKKNKTLSFQSGEVAKEFLNNFRDLIEEVGDLI